MRRSLVHGTRASRIGFRTCACTGHPYGLSGELIVRFLALVDLISWGRGTRFASGDLIQMDTEQHFPKGNTVVWSQCIRRQLPEQLQRVGVGGCMWGRQVSRDNLEVALRSRHSSNSLSFTASWMYSARCATPSLS